MNSFLFITKRENMPERAVAFCKKHGIVDIDITIVDTIPDKNQKSSEKGIGLIRKIINSIALKPIRGKSKAVIILNSDKLSIPAQNALLKTLEEPPLDTIIVLTAENEFSLLPTIRSRCQVIKYAQAANEIKNGSEEDLSNLAPLEKAEAISKDKEKALLFLEKEIKSLEKIMQEKTDKNPLDESVSKTQRILTSHLKAYDIIKSTNTNLRLTLENLFLSESL